MIILQVVSTLRLLILGGLNEQFKQHTCVLNYMLEYKDQEQCIIGNYIVMFSHVFEGLRYLHSKHIVHGDVKGQSMLGKYVILH